MNYQYDISPITKVKTIVYCKYRIIVDDIQFGENTAIVRVILADETEEHLKEFVYQLTQQEYQSWDTDQKLKDIIKGKLRNEIF